MPDLSSSRRNPVARALAVIPGVTFGVIALFIFFAVMRPRFIGWPNLQLIARHSSVLLVAAIGMTMVILVSQIDLSVGSVMSLAGVVAAYAMRQDWGFPVAILLGLGCGLLVGLVNGIMVAVFKFDYWIATFGTMGIGAGLALVVAGGETIPVAASIHGPAFGWIGNARIMLAPKTPLYFLPCFALALIVIMWLVLKKTRFGYNIYSIGGSEQAARLSGVNVVRNRIYVYICSGFFAAVAGLMLASMTNSASPIAGADYSFDVIAAVIIGGTSFDGGRGGLFGTVMGALMVRTLASGLNLMNILPTWQKTIIGFAIVAIIVADVLGEKRKHRRELMRRYRDA
ncbi:MAG: ABC transporter permease [Planctomycetes bacterium]|nr:ABC transporter permease [Planctomycetota bacterium]